MVMILYERLAEVFGQDLIIRKDDGYINAGQLCAYRGKNFQHWLVNQHTKALLYELSKKYDKCLIETSRTENRHGTFIHPCLVISLAKWISPEFDAIVSKWVSELIVTGVLNISTVDT